jgi:Domain of unknown function (DUF4430)
LRHRRPHGLLAALIAAAGLAAGCGLGAGEELGGDGATLRVTRDFGHKALGSLSEPKLREDQTVMRLLRSKFDVDTRFGGRFVQSIDGLSGHGGGGRQDWFFFVNGVEADEGAGDYELSPGDRVQWDYRNWEHAARAPAIVGAFPEPFVHGVGGRRRPVRVECENVGSAACRDAKSRLEKVGARANGSSIGAPATEKIIRLVVATWPRAKIVRGADTLEQGPDRSGVFARVAGDGGRIELLDPAGDVARTVRPGDGTALVAALRPTANEIVWLVTGLDEGALDAGVRALSARRLRDAYAVAVTGDRVEKLPVEGP